MKIVLFIHQSSEMYGSDKVLLYIASGLSMKGDFHPVIVIPDTGPLYSSLAANGVEVHVGEVLKISRAVFSPLGLIRLFAKTFKALRGLDRIVNGRSVAVVHSNTLAVLAGAVWAFLRRQKHLWHVHEIILSPRAVTKAFPWFVKRFSDSVISNSTMTQQWLLSEQPSLASRSVVIFNGLPPVVKPSDAAIRAFRKRIGAFDGDVVITLVGRINRWKGQELLLEAALLLKQRGLENSLRFVIVGSAASGLEDLPGRLEKQAVLAGIGDRCSFMPFVDDIWPVWFGTDIAVVPSIEPEPFGMVAIEAMAAGVPVVAARHGGLLDIVVDEETGLHFEPRDASALADAIARLASDEALRKRLGTAGDRRQHKMFSVQSQIERTTEVYKRIQP